MPCISQTSDWDSPALETLRKGEDIWIADGDKVLRARVTKFNSDTYWYELGDLAAPLRGFKLGMYWMRVRPAKTTMGVTCKSCNTINEFASPNRPDGSYVCYNCR
jgi:hypothetical protein